MANTVFPGEVRHGIHALAPPTGTSQQRSPVNRAECEVRN